MCTISGTPSPTHPPLSRRGTTTTRRMRKMDSVLGVRVTTTRNTTSSMTTDHQLNILVKLTELGGLIENADSRSIRWLYDRYDGLQQFADSLESATGIEGLIKFFINEPDILAEIDNDALEWDD